MPYNPHGDEGVELWKLGLWPELEVLNLKDFNGRNVVRIGSSAWTTRGAVRDYPSVRKLWIYHGMLSSFGQFPNLEEVHVAENDRGPLPRRNDSGLP